MISWGLAKLSFKADAAFEALCDAAVEQIEHFAPQNLVQLAISGIYFGRNEEIRRVFAGICGYLHVFQLRKQGVVLEKWLLCTCDGCPRQLMWACGTAGYRHEAFLRAAARVAKRTVQDFSSQHQSNFLWACARRGSSARQVVEMEVVCIYDSIYDVIYSI